MHVRLRPADFSRHRRFAPALNSSASITVPPWFPDASLPSPIIHATFRVNRIETRHHRRHRPPKAGTPESVVPWMACSAQDVARCQGWHSGSPTPVPAHPVPLCGACCVQPSRSPVGRTCVRERSSMPRTRFAYTINHWRSSASVTLQPPPIGASPLGLAWKTRPPPSACGTLNANARLPHRQPRRALNPAASPQRRSLPAIDSGWIPRLTHGSTTSVKRSVKTSAGSFRRWWRWWRVPGSGRGT
ncbi:hypothetical protein ACEQUB_p01417 (plasmid) [Ralstonia syzygii]